MTRSDLLSTYSDGSAPLAFGDALRLDPQLVPIGIQQRDGGNAAIRTHVRSEVSAAPELEQQRLSRS